MANKKLYLIYFWADERIMLDDFKRGYSARMTDWASKFYAQYKFDLSIVPADRTSVPRSLKYALRKNDGVRPDWRLVSKITEEGDAKKALLFPQIAAIEKQRLDAARRVQDAERSVDIHDREARRLLTALINSTGATFDAIKAELAVAEARQLNAHNIADREVAKAKRLREEWERLQGELSAAVASNIAKLDKRAAAENFFREQLAEAYRNHKIGSRKTLNIIFCRAAGIMRMRPDKYGIVGLTYDLKSSAVVPLKTMKPVWPFPFIAIDLEASRSTLAHEMVHAAGHGAHPSDRMIRIVEKQISGLTFPRTVGPGAKPSLFHDVKYTYEDVERFEILPGGYDDGTENDIMRYRNDDPEADKLVLSKEDQELMDDAWFGDP